MPWETYQEYIEATDGDDGTANTELLGSEIPAGSRDPRFQGKAPTNTGRREETRRENQPSSRVRVEDRGREWEFVERVPPPPRFEEERPEDEVRRQRQRQEGEGRREGGENEPRALTYGEKMDGREEGIYDFTQFSIDKKIELAKEMRLPSREKYKSNLEKPFLDGEYDHVAIVFNDFLPTHDEQVRANGGFGNLTEQSVLRRMKNQARGKRVGIYYVNTSADNSGSPHMPVVLQRALWMIEGNQKVKMNGVAVFSGKDLSKPSHQWMENLGVGTTWFRSRVADPEGYSDPTERPSVPPEGQKKWRDAVGEEEPEAWTEIQNVTTIAEYATMREGLADGERVLTIWWTTREKIADAKLLQLTSYYAKKWVKVVYIPNADNNAVWKGKFDAWIVTKADGEPAMFPESKIPADATKHHKVQLPFALIVQRTGTSYAGTWYATAERW